MSKFDGLHAELDKLDAVALVYTKADADDVVVGTGDDGGDILANLTGDEWANAKDIMGKLSEWSWDVLEDVVCGVVADRIGGAS